MKEVKKSQAANPKAIGKKTQANATPSPSPRIEEDKAKRDSDLDDLDTIFSAAKKGSANKTPQHATKKTNTPTNREAADGGQPSRVEKRPRIAGEDGTPARRKRDGLYHAPEKSMGMSDTDFFSGTSATQSADGKRHSKRLATVSESEAQQLKQEGVDRIVSMKELQGMLSRNPRAGMTPDCPFGCDCCF